MDMLDKNKKPTVEDMSEYIDNQLFNTYYNFLKEEHKALERIDFSRDTYAMGWNLKLRKAGKATTIKAIVGIHDFESGDIKIYGHSIKEEPIFCKNLMAYIPDNPDLYEYLTGFQYINFIADLSNIPKETRLEKIKKYGDLFEMTPRLPEIISSYSHGMKQRTAIISALIHSPKLLILDEPFVGLDPNAAFILKKIMMEIVSEGGSIFFSTHVLEVAEKLCNKVAVIKNGKLIASGDMEDIKGNKSLEEFFMEVQKNEQNFDIS